MDYMAHSYPLYSVICFSLNECTNPCVHAGEQVCYSIAATDTDLLENKLPHSRLMCVFTVIGHQQRAPRVEKQCQTGITPATVKSEDPLLGGITAEESMEGVCYERVRSSIS